MKRFCNPAVHDEMKEIYPFSETDWFQSTKSISESVYFLPPLKSSFPLFTIELGKVGITA
jgi:hypothetical protein